MAISSVRSQRFERIRWQTPVDLQPQYVDNDLLVHYGSPLVTAENTVIVAVKTGASGGFRVEAHNGIDGSLKWMLPSDYVPPTSPWLPEFAPVIAAGTHSRVYAPGAGGTLLFRDDPDLPTGDTGRVAFYGTSAYTANPSAYDASVLINTPLTADAAGDVYFGFFVMGAAPSSLVSGIARVTPSGDGIWVAAAVAASDQAVTHVVYNCAPALSADSRTLYVAVSGGNSRGYLVALDSSTLTPLGRTRLKDPATGIDAVLPDTGTASPTVGPDGDVYFGVFESSNEHHERGWLLHFDKTLALAKTPGGFGWDDTASVVPASLMPSYSGSSRYLLMTKYNDYIEAGGTGMNRIAILDPNVTAPDSITGTRVMREVLTIVGPTPDPSVGGVKEWCINTAAVDPATRSVLAGSEDGKLYRWDLASNTFSEMIVLTPGIGEAYTPTVIGADGTVYAINNGTLFAVGEERRR
jgi:hypothetical protein